MNCKCGGNMIGFFIDRTNKTKDVRQLYLCEYCNNKVGYRINIIGTDIAYIEIDEEEVYAEVNKLLLPNHLEFHHHGAI